MKSILQKKFYQFERKKLEDAVVKTLSLKDKFSLNDRLDGVTFLKKKKKNYFINKFFMEEVLLKKQNLEINQILDFDLEGFLNEKNLDYKITEDILEVVKIRGKFDVIFFFNSMSLQVSLYGDESILKKINA
tara:strand:+ start:372 stop:767 length:396 start_codon:yes stop_codon:yes gene_type:complete